MVKPEALLERLVKDIPNIEVADLQAFIAHYAQVEESVLAADLARAKSMFGLGKKKRSSLTPPAGLTAREAVPIVVAYVREEKGRPVSLSKQERQSFSALVAALDRQFGTGFAQRIIDELNAMPNGSHSLHYKR